MRTRTVARVLLLAAVAGWLATSITTVNAGESGVVLRFGRAARLAAPGVLLKLPWPLERVERVDVGLSRRMPIGYRLVDAERGIDPLPREVQWLTGDSNIVELRANVLYRVEDPRAWLFGVADGPGEEGHRSFTLRRIGESALSELIARMPVRDVLAPGNAGLQSRARDSIQARCNALGLGVRVTAVEVVETTPPLMVIHAFNAVTDAKAEAERLVVEAEGARLKDLQDAEAMASATRSEAQGEAIRKVGHAEGLALRIEAQVGPGGELSEAALRALWAETVSQVLGRARVTIVPGGPEGEPVLHVRYR